MINEKQAKKFCKEDISKIKNYDLAIADKTQTWHCHHRTAIWWNCSKKDLIANECYYNRKACELMFLTPEEHKRLHNKGQIISEETRRKLSEAHKGKHHSEESRIKMSEAHKGKTFTEEHRRKMSEAQKGKHLSEEQRIKISESSKGHIFSEESRRKMSEAHKGKVPWNKGKHHSEESRIKISAATKLRWAAIKNLKTNNT